MAQNDASRRARERERAAVLHAAIPSVVEVLANRFGVRRIWLFGSLVWGFPHEASDLDVAVEGLASTDYFRALGELLEVVPGGVDLVRLEEAPDSLRVRILQSGEVIHERP
jgi:predicted nucleotidyltransferase